MLTLAIVSFSPCSAAISSRTGATILHGPHHSAQKSTRTGLSLASTSVSKVSSVTVLVAAPMLSPGVKVQSSNVPGGADIPAAPRSGSCGGSLTVGEEALGVESRCAAGAGSGDRLPVGVVDQVAACKHAGEVG